MINYVNEDDLFSPTCPRATGARHTVNLHIPICNSLIGKVGLRPRSQLATRSNISSMQDKKKNIITIKKHQKIVWLFSLLSNNTRIFTMIDDTRFSQENQLSNHSRLSSSLNFHLSLPTRDSKIHLLSHLWEIYLYYTNLDPSRIATWIKQVY